MVDVDRAIASKLQPPDYLIGELAAQQHGVVARRQLLDVGLSADMIDHRLTIGRMHLVHRGVYRVGGLTRHGRLLAAVLACGPEALLSHRSAAVLWGLLPSAAARIDVIGGGRQRRGICVRHTRSLHGEDRAERDSIPCTSVARTIADLAALQDRKRLERTIERAEQLQLFDLRALERVRERGSGRQGMRLLGAALAGYREPPLTRSQLERKFLDLCRADGLPIPTINATVAGLEVDALWKDQRLVVELDGYTFHRSRAAFERDRERDINLQVAGYRVLRITALRIARRPNEAVAAIRRLLRISPPSG